MAINTGTLTVQVIETLTLNGTAIGGSNTLTVNSVQDAYKRVITVPTSPEVTLYTTHASTVGGAQFDVDLVKYIRVTNKDGSNFVAIRVTDANSDEFLYKLEAGASFILGTHATGAMSGGKAENAGAAPDAAIVSMEAQADTGACDCEIFVATT